jgi:molybdopterin synthase catalytic subunit
MTATVRCSASRFDAAAEAAKLRSGRTDIGALVTFTGICRGDEGGSPLSP